MSTPRIDDTPRRAAAIARRLAADHPDQLMPCPACGQEVKGRNLDRHLTEVHALPAGPAGNANTLHGSDQAIWRWLLGGFLGSTLVLFPALLQVLPQQLAAGLMLALLALLAVGAGLALAGRFPSRLRVHSGGVELVRTLGRSHTRLRYPLQIETGSLEEHRQGGVVRDSRALSIIPVGSYLGLVGAEGGRILVGAKRSTHPRRFWSFRHLQGRPRRFWELQLSPAQVVQLQYLLAEHDVLQLRTGEEAHT